MGDTAPTPKISRAHLKMAARVLEVLPELLEEKYQESGGGPPDFSDMAFYYARQGWNWNLSLSELVGLIGWCAE